MNRAHLLIVEDEYLAAEALRDALMAAGAYCIHAVPSVRAALEVLLEHRIDAAVLDVDLRGENSTPVADALSLARIPFVFFTGGTGTAVGPAHKDVTLVQKPAVEQLIGIVSGFCTRVAGG